MAEQFAALVETATDPKQKAFYDRMSRKWRGNLGRAPGSAFTTQVFVFASRLASIVTAVGAPQPTGPALVSRWAAERDRQGAQSKPCDVQTIEGAKQRAVMLQAPLAHA
jgi:hypothetical protein